MGLGHAIKYHASLSTDPATKAWADSVDPDAYDKIILADLDDGADTAKQQETIGDIRKHLPALGHMSDGQLQQYARQVGAPPPPPDKSIPNAPDEPRTLANIHKQNKALFESSEAPFNSLKNKLKMNIKAIGNGQPPSDAFDDARAKANLEVPHRAALKAPSREEEPGMKRYPVIEDQREVLPAIKSGKIKQQLPGYGMGMQATLNVPNRGGKEGPTKMVGAMDVNSSVAPELTEGWSLPMYFMGQTDPLGGAAANIIAATTGVDEKSSLGPRYKPKGMMGLDPRNGYGLPEVGGDIGEQVEKRDRELSQMWADSPVGEYLPSAITDPNWSVKTDANAVKAMKVLEGGYYGGKATLKELLAKGVKSVMPPGIGGEPASTPTLDQWGKNDRENEESAYGEAQNAEDLARDVGGLPQEDVSNLYGRLQGRNAGIIGQGVLPTGAGNMLSRGAKTQTGRMIIEEGVKPALAPIVNPIRRYVAPFMARMAGETAPSRFGLPDDSLARQSLENGVIARRTHGEMVEMMQRDGSLNDAMAVFNKHGVTDQKVIDKALQEINNEWALVESRANADPLYKDLYDAMQPWHEKNWLKSDMARRLAEEQQAVPPVPSAPAPAPVPTPTAPTPPVDVPPSTANYYNPLAPQYGQNINKPNQFFETGAGRQAEEAGGKAWVAKDVHDANAMTLPGIRNLGPDIVPTATKEMRSLDEIAKQRNYLERGKPFLDTENGLRLRKTKAEMDADYKNMRAMSFPEASGKTARAMAEDNGEQYQAAAAEVVKNFDELMRREPDRYMTKAQLNKMMLDEQVNMRRFAARKQTGDVRKGMEKAFGSEDYEKFMQKHDLIMVRVMPEEEIAKQAAASARGKEAPRGLWGKREILLPSGVGLDNLDGHAVDPLFAKAADELVHPNKRMESAKRFSKLMDQAFGLPQVKRAITYGVPAFDMRVSTGDFLRHIEKEGAAGMSPKYRSIVQKASNALPGSLAEKETVELGGQKYTIGQLRDGMLKYGDVRRSFSREVEREASSQPGMGRLIGNIPLVGTKLDAIGTKAAHTMAKPGMKSGEMSDALWRTLFDDPKTGQTLNKGYAANEGIRMLNIITQMDRGVGMDVAGKQARQMMVDFGDTNALKDGVRWAIPFVDFWSQGLKGALDVGRSNPRGFSRAFDIARMQESADQAEHGGAFDPRTKSWSATLGAKARIQDDNGNVVERGQEGPLKDTTDVAEAVYNTGDQWFGANGKDNQGPNLGQMLGPSLSKAKSFVTGRDFNGRLVVPGVDAKEQGRLSGTLPQQLYQLVQDGAITKEQALLVMAKNLPMAPAIAGPTELAARLATGGKSPQDNINALSRTAVAYSGLARERDAKNLLTGVQAIRNADKEMPDSIPAANKTRKKKGNPLQNAIRNAIGGSP